MAGPGRVYSVTLENDMVISLDRDKVDIGKYMTKLQPLLSAVIEKPKSVLPRDLEEVTYGIVNRAWEDPTYPYIAAEICIFIAQLEKEDKKYDAIPQYDFQTYFYNCCSEIMGEWDDMRAKSRQEFHSFIKFIAESYRLSHVGRVVMAGVSRIILNVIEVLLTPLCIKNPTENDLLYIVFCKCGKYLECEESYSMLQVINNLRDLFLSSNIDQHVSETLLHIIELKAAKWTLPASTETCYAGLSNVS